VADVAFPERSSIVYKISLSRFSIGTGIEEISNNTEGRIKTKAADFQLFSTAVDKMDDSSDVRQLAIFVC
jgi:hypothetical protein